MSKVFLIILNIKKFNPELWLQYLLLNMIELFIFILFLFNI